MLILLFACTSPATPPSTHPDTSSETGSADSGTDTGRDTGASADSVADSDSDSGIGTEACPVINRWTERAAFPKGETITWALTGCGVPLHVGCADPAVALPTFSGTLSEGTFTWSVAALDVGVTECTLTVADPRDDDRVDYAVTITVLD